MTATPAPRHPGVVCHEADDRLRADAVTRHVATRIARERTDAKWPVFAAALLVARGAAAIRRDDFARLAAITPGDLDDLEAGMVHPGHAPALLATLLPGTDWLGYVTALGLPDAPCPPGSLGAEVAARAASQAASHAGEARPGTPDATRRRHPSARPGGVVRLPGPDLGR